MLHGGLKRGDQILTDNGISLEGLTHQKAVNILKSCERNVIDSRLAKSKIEKVISDDLTEDSSETPSHTRTIAMLSQVLNKRLLKTNLQMIMDFIPDVNSHQYLNPKLKYQVPQFLNLWLNQL